MPCAEEGLLLELHRVMGCWHTVAASQPGRAARTSASNVLAAKGGKALQGARPLSFRLWRRQAKLNTSEGRQELLLCHF